MRREMPVKSLAPPGRDVLLSPPILELLSPAQEKSPSNGDEDKPPATEVHRASDDGFGNATAFAVPGEGNARPLTPPRMDPNVETRSLNLVCYRHGRQGCSPHQIKVVRWKKDGDKVFTGLPVAVGAITTNEAFMRALQRGYEDKMCGFWRRVFSLKSLRFVRLREVPNVLRK